MNAHEARKLIHLLKGKLGLEDSQDVIHEALKFLAWTIECQENMDTLYMERNGCLEDIILLYERSKNGVMSDVG